MLLQSAHQELASRLRWTQLHQACSSTLAVCSVLTPRSLAKRGLTTPSLGALQSKLRYKRHDVRATSGIACHAMPVLGHSRCEAVVALREPVIACKVTYDCWHAISSLCCISMTRSMHCPSLACMLVSYDDVAVVVSCCNCACRSIHAGNMQATMCFVAELPKRWTHAAMCLHACLQ